MEKIKCLKCEWEWTPRVETPKNCPKCKSYSWWIEPNSKCDICGRIFQNLHEHHINGNRNDNSKKNKIKICYDCHSIIHMGFSIIDKKKHKRIRRYLYESEIRKKLERLHNEYYLNKQETK